MHEFNVVLVSNASHSLSPNNSLTKFTNHFPKDILDRLEEEVDVNWQVKVNSIGVSTEYENVDLPPDHIPCFVILPNFNNVSPSDTFTSEFVEIPDTNKLYITPQNVEPFSIANIIYQFFKYYNEMIEKHFRYVIDFSYNKKINILIKPRSFTDPDLNFPPLTDHLAYKKSIAIFKPLAEQLNFDTTKGFTKIVNETEYVIFTLNGFPSNIPSAVKKEEREALGRVYTLETLRSEEPLIRFSKEIPKLVQVGTNIVKPILGNCSNQKILYKCSLPKEVSGDYFRFFKNKSNSYYNVQFDEIKSISIEILDEKNKLFPVIIGIPTIIELKFKKMDSQFNVEVDSSKSDLHPRNTNSNFIVKLNNPINVSSEYHVALSSIHFPNTIMNVPKYIHDEGTFRIQRFNGKPDKLYPVPFGSFKNIQDYIDKCNESLSASPVQIRLEVKNKKMTFQAEEKCALSVPYLIGSIFGKLIDSEAIRLGADTCSVLIKPGVRSYWERDVNIDFLTPKYILLYTSIVEPVITGEQYTRLLRVVPITKSKDNYLTIEFDEPTYLQLQNSYIENIEFQLRGHDGRLIDFFDDLEKTIISLNFKQIK